MSALEFVRTGWACVTETLCGPYVSLEGTTPEDTEPVIFDTREEAEAERDQYIDDVIEAGMHGLDADPGELEALLEDARDSLEAEEFVAFVGIDRAGEVHELDPESLAIYRRLRRPDR